MNFRYYKGQIIKKIAKWRVSDSNTQPSALEADALPLRQPSLLDFKFLYYVDEPYVLFLIIFEILNAYLICFNDLKSFFFYT